MKRTVINGKTYETNMDPEVRDAWLAALRSGEYRQARGVLRVEMDDGELGHCCLGVLCDVLGVKWQKRAPFGFHYVDPCGVEQYGMLDHEARRELGFGFGSGVTTVGTAHDLANMNDEGATFEEIADFIEAVF